MKKIPKQIPLTDNPRTKKVASFPLESKDTLDIINKDEDHQQNNTQSIQQLESDQRD